jgi:serine/threonine protein kinase
MKKIQSNLNVSTEDPLKIWDLTERLGEGGVGTVWKAINKRNGQVAAVKIIGLDGNDEGLEDILIEINILKDCQHENVVGYYGSYLNKGKELWVRMSSCCIFILISHLPSPIHPFALLSFFSIRIHTTCRFCRQREHIISAAPAHAFDGCLWCVGGARADSHGVLRRRFGERL